MNSRQKLSPISTDQAEILLRVVDQLHQAQYAAAQRLTAFSQVFQLLARWAHNSQLAPAQLSKDKDAFRDQLQAAVKGALQFLHSQWLAPRAAAACILFLGAASKGESYRMHAGLPVMLCFLSALFLQ